MAEIVLGLGASHGPPVTMPATQWHMLREKDVHDKRMDYNALLKVAKPNIDEEWTEERMQTRYDTAQRSLGTLRDVLAQTAPDVVIVVGDDQNEQFGADQMPAFCVYRGPSVEVKKRAGVGERTLVTTLTKRMAEDLTEYYQQMGLRVRYLHSDIDTLDRVELIRDLRLGKFDCLIGINLLREGLDIPEVSLVAILDADKEGYLRSATSLTQTAGRAARNVRGEVILYADRVTNSMKVTLAETERRRQIQEEYNRTHGITPESIKKSIRELLQTVWERDYYTVEVAREQEEAYASTEALEGRVKELEAAMKDAARRLDFERAAELRDRIKALKKQDLTLR